MSHVFPTSILPNLAWSFHHAAPGNVETFLAEIRQYCDGLNDAEAIALLQMHFPASALDIDYAYAVRGPNGEWDDVTETVRIRRSSPPTYLDILFELQFAAERNLAEQDHCFFEGLWLQAKEYETGIPVYRLYLGS